jgi:hypothetical protein
MGVLGQPLQFAAVTAVATIICPLEFERRELRRARALRTHRFITCGPGDAVRRCVESLRGDAPVILAGVAGSLRDTVTPGMAFTASEVVDGDRVWTPGLRLAADARPITSTATILDAGAKRDLASACPADLVDLESVPFAEAATAAGHVWGIVRGVSDGFDESLPPEAAGWTRPDGRTRVAAVAAGVMRRPALGPRILRLGRQSREALGSAAVLLATLLGHPPCPG